MRHDTDQQTEKPTDDTPQARKPKPRRRLRRVLIALCILLVVLAAAPSVVSALWGPAIMESLVNAEIKGRLTVQEVSLSWFGPVELEGLQVFDPDGRKVAETRLITLKKNLFGLIASWADLNELDVHEPRLQLHVDEDGSVSLAKAFEPRTPSKEPTPPPPLKGKITLIDGRGEIIRHDGRRREFSFDAECLLATLNDIKASFNAQADGIGRLKGNIAAAGFAPDGPVDLDAVSGTINLESSSPIDLGAVAKLTGRKGIGGTATLSIDGKLSAGRFTGELTTAVARFVAAEHSPEKARPIDAKLSLAVTASRNDAKGKINLVAPQAGAMSLAIDYKHPPGGWNLKPSSILEALAAGRTVELPEITIVPTVDINLARLAAAAPDLLNIRRDATLQELTVRVADTVLRGGKRPEIIGRVEIGQARATVAGTPVRWAPTTAALAIRTAADGLLQIDKVDVNVGQGLVRITTTGTTKDATFQASARLAELKQQMGQVFDLKKLVLGGNVSLAGRIQRQAPASADAKDKATRVKVDLTASAESVKYLADRTLGGEAMSVDTQAAWKADIVRIGDSISADGKLDLTKLALTVAGRQIQQNALSLGHDVTIDLKKHVANLTKLELASQPATVSLTGKIEQFNKRPIADVSGSYAIAWPKVAPIIKQFFPEAPGNPALLGKTSGTFQLADSADKVRGQFTLAGEIGKLKGRFSAVKTTEPIGAITKRVLAAITSNKPLSLPEISADADGRIMVSPLLAAAGLTNKLPKDLKLTGGHLNIRKFSLRGGGRPKLNADILAENITGARGGKTVKLDDVAVLAAAGGDSTGRLRIDKASFTAGFAKLNAAGSIGDFTLKGDADLAKLKSQLDQFIDLPSSLAGTINLNATIRKVGGSYDKLAVGLDAAAKDFQLVRQPSAGAKIKPLRLKPRTFTIAYNGQVDRKTETISIAKMQAKFAPQLLTLDMSGTVKKVRSQWMLDLAGKYVGQWDQINALLEELQPGVTRAASLTGRSAGGFTVKGLSHNPSVTPTYRGVAGDTVLAWDKGQALGLPLGEGKLTPKLVDGQIVLPLTKLAVSEGTAQIAAVVDLRGKEPVLRLPPRLLALKDVQLTPKFSKEVLGRINPIFAGLGHVKGKVSLRLDGMEVPLGESLKTGGKGVGRLDLTKLNVRPSGLLESLLTLQGVPSEVDYPVAVNGLDFRIRKGGVEYDNFTMTFPKGMQIGFSGRVGFDDTVSMTAWTPVSAPLLRRFGVQGATATQYATVLKGMRIGIPVSGNRKDPKLDVTKVDIKPLIKKAAERLLQDRVKDLIFDRLPELKLP